MRIFRTVCLFLVCLPLQALPAVSAGQSLGNVAKKERERRDKNKKEGVSAREFSEEEVFGENEDEKAPEASEGEAAEQPEPRDGASHQTDEAAVIPGVEKKLEDDGERFEKESRERKRSEAEWRAKVSSARSRIAEARKAVQFFEELALPADGRYVDAYGNTVIDSLDHLQRLTREAKEELAAAELDWKRIQDDARRAGIPPGWLR